MKRFVLILLTLISGCGGKLSDEQRKQMKEGMEQQKIVQLSDSEIVTAALVQGQTIFNVLEKLKFDPTKIDSVARHYRVNIYWRTPGSSDAIYKIILPFDLSQTSSNLKQKNRV